MTNDDLAALLDALDARANDAEMEAVFCADVANQRQADYNIGKSTGYRGAARLVRFYLAREFE